MKSLFSRLNHAMLFMMAVFLIIAMIQILLMLYLSWTMLQENLLRLCDYGRFSYLPLTLFFLTLSLGGWLYESSATRLAQRGLRYRNGLLTHSLNILTHRSTLDAQLVRQQHEMALDTEELAASFRAIINGQDALCEDLAQQLRRRLTLRHPDKPVAVFLFAGPPDTGKITLAKAIAQQTGRPFLKINSTQLSCFHNRLQKEPEAVVVLENIEKASSHTIKQILQTWDNNVFGDNNSSTPTLARNALFILTAECSTAPLATPDHHSPNKANIMQQEALHHLEETGLSASLLNCIDRFFLFYPLQGLDLARVATRRIEQTITGYGLHVETGGLDPILLFKWMQQTSTHNPVTSPRQLCRAIEDQISESLIQARQQNKTHISLTMDENIIHAEASNAHEQRLNKASP